MSPTDEHGNTLFTPFEMEVRGFMSEMREHMKNQAPRCDSHAKDIKAVDERVTSLEDSRTFIKGMFSLVGKAAVVATAISGIVFGWLNYFGEHADKVVK